MPSPVAISDLGRTSSTLTATGSRAAAGSATDSNTTTHAESPRVLILRRFHGSATLDSTRLSRDADVIAASVVQHLAGLLDAKVKITIEIEAEIPSGVPESVVRTVTENCRTLKFDNQGFDEG
jgi:hypothetical protein